MTKELIINLKDLIDSKYISLEDLQKKLDLLATKEEVENLKVEVESELDKKLDKSELLDLTYPVGSIYTSINSTSPEKLFGGSWSKLNSDIFLKNSGSEVVGKTGGYKDAVVVKHTHTQNAHSHKPLKDSYFLEATGNVAANMTDRQWPSQSSTEHYHSVYIPTDAGTVTIDESTATATVTAVNQETGEDGTDKNLPPYLTVNMWQRTA